VPQNLVRQWVREILFYWPIFTLVISYDDGHMEQFLADHMVSASDVRNWPDAGMWPSKYGYMLDKYDIRNGQTIFLTTPETHAERSVKEEEILHGAKPFDPPQFVAIGRKKKEVYEADEWTETKQLFPWERVFSLVVVDEATKTKTVGKVRHQAIRALRAKRWIVVTATPMMNQVTIIHTKTAFWRGMQD
jgi:hypothetical protein